MNPGSPFQVVPNSPQEPLLPQSPETTQDEAVAPTNINPDDLPDVIPPVTTAQVQPSAPVLNIDNIISHANVAVPVANNNSVLSSATNSHNADTDNRPSTSRAIFDAGRRNRVATPVPLPRTLYREVFTYLNRTASQHSSRGVSSNSDEAFQPSQNYEGGTSGRNMPIVAGFNTFRHSSNSENHVSIGVDITAGGSSFNIQDEFSHTPAKQLKEDMHQDKNSPSTDESMESKPESEGSDMGVDNSAVLMKEIKNLCEKLNRFDIGKIDTGFKCDYGDNRYDKRCECGRSLGRPVKNPETGKMILENTGMDQPHHFANWMHIEGLHPNIYNLKGSLSQKSICPAGRFYQSRDLLEYFEAESQKPDGKYKEHKKSATEEHLKWRPDLMYFIACKKQAEYYFQLYFGNDEKCVAGHGPYDDKEQRRYFYNAEYSKSRGYEEKELTEENQ
ncbi:hypothetical protein DdX_15053 [Ditylenchus destructor]|uniref:Uncharacterized protein n=1 Tax=Ditylenchus destructor TaxID=166010 RepID=A0AAD4R175_9BILA|nr:hypothetical protein DdX_15053 [Ditylenchus destructor]